MPYCARCGSAVEGDDAFCVACGATTGRGSQPPRSASESAWPAEGASGAHLSTPPDLGRSAAGLRALWRRGRITAVLLGLSAVIAVATALSAAALLGDLFPLARGDEVPDGVLLDHFERNATIGGLSLLAFIITGVFWLTWQHRAHENLRLLGAGGLRFTPAWAVAWWLIPLANLVQPFRAVRELWRTSCPEPDGSRRRSAPLVGLWWAAWLTANLLPSVGGGLRFQAPVNVDTLTTEASLIIAGNLVQLFAAVLAILIILDVNRGQRRMHELVSELFPPGDRPGH